MILSRQVKVYPILFANFALAALQNVTVDDAVLTGAVVPQYLPSPSNWNIGNNCSVCLVHPDPLQTYGGTWHDATYIPPTNITQAIEFTFTGSGLYIFFITANNVTGATTLTSIEFTLDQAPVGTYIHTPSASTDYQYNVLVYANDSLVPGEHSIVIQPINTGNHVLMLFDYLVYTMDTSPTSATPSPSSTSTTSTETSSKPNLGGIIGGVLGGVAALALVAISLLCYWRHQGRNGDRASNERAVVDPFALSHETDPATLVGMASSTYPHASIGFPTTVSSSGRTFSTQQPSDLPASTTGPSSSINDPALVEEVESLRNEVARLRRFRESNRESIELPSEAPPKYS